MIGKISHSLMNLTGDVKKQNISIHFKVTEIGRQGKNKHCRHELAASSLKDSSEETAKKLFFHLYAKQQTRFAKNKTVIITRGAVKGSVAARLRHVYTVCCKNCK